MTGLAKDSSFETIVSLLMQIYDDQLFVEITMLYLFSGRLEYSPGCL